MKTRASKHRYQVPQVQSDHLSRSRLQSILDRPSACVLVSAPSGFGKSSLVADWLTQQSAPTIWMNLQEEPYTLDVFLVQLLEPIEPLFPSEMKPVQSLFSKSEKTSDEELERAFLLALDQVDEDITLVIDDLHLIADEAIHRFLTALVERQALRKLVLITRYDPPLPLVIWRQHGSLQEIRVADLRFTEDEVSALLRGISSEEDSRRVSEDIDGWIAGIRLLTYGVHSQEDLRAKLSVFETEGGRDFARMVRWYLNPMSTRQREAVLALSLFDSFSVDLLVAIGWHEGAEEVMKEITSSKLLIIPLDYEGGWYRFHHLFQQVLQEIAREETPAGRMTALLTKGGSYLKASEEYESAIKCFLSAGRATEALAVFAILRKRLLDGREWVVLESAKRMLERGGVKHLLLDLTTCWLYVHEGKPREMFELLTTIEGSIDDSFPIESNTEYHAEYRSLLAYRTYNVDQDFDRCILDCEFALQHLGNDWNYPKGLAWVFLLGSLQATGRMDAVEDRASTALASQIPTFEKGNIWFVLCYIYYFESDLTQLGVAAQALIDLGTEVHDDEFVAHGAYFKVLRSFTLGQWSEAQNISKKYDAYLQHGLGVVQFFHRMLRVALAQHLGDTKGWQEMNDQTLNDAYRQRNRLLPTYIKAKTAELEMLDGNIAKATSMLLGIGPIPMHPVTQDSDPKLCRINCFLESGQKPLEEQAKEEIDTLRRLLTTHHNRAGLVKLDIYEAIYWFLQGHEDRARNFLDAAIKVAVTSSLVSPFANCNSHLLALLQLLNAEDYYYRDYVQQLISVLSRRGQEPSEISRREKEILELLSQKLSNREIADRLYISEKTVKNHSHQLFKKLGVKNRREAAAKAESLHLLDV